MIITVAEAPPIISPKLPFSQRSCGRKSATMLSTQRAWTWMAFLDRLRHHLMAFLFSALSRFCSICKIVHTGQRSRVIFSRQPCQDFYHMHEHHLSLHALSFSSISKPHRPILASVLDNLLPAPLSSPPSPAQHFLSLHVPSSLLVCRSYVDQ